MCLGATLTRVALSAAGLAFFSCSGFAQVAESWKRVGGTAVNESLAGAVSGPVKAVWYAAGTHELLAQTTSGRVFETADFIHWKLNTLEATPGAGAKAQKAGLRQYMINASNLYASDDAGRTWLNLTGFNGNSVLGDGFTSIAVSPANPQEVTVSNNFGVWRSLDGGLSWRGLNDELPNLLVRRLLNRRMAVLADGGIVDFTAGSWSRVRDLNPEAELIARFAASAHVRVSAAAQSGSLEYAGTPDGRLLVSRNNGESWTEALRVAGSLPIDALWVDSGQPEVALAAATGKLLRTTNGGLFWDDVTGSLPGTVIHGIAADRSAAVVYLATDRGVFSGGLSLDDAGPASPGWVSVSAGLPAAAAWDVLLSADNTLTVALDGYGVYETAAPHRMRSARIVNAADLSDRAAAPGSLISVLGANVGAVAAGLVAFPVIASSDRNSQLQVPFDVRPGTVSLAIEAGGERWTAPLTVKDAAPAIFVDSDGAPLVLDAASGLVLDPNVAVRAASGVQLLATGLGKVTPEWPSGVPAPLDSPPRVNAAVTAFLDGSPVQVTRATLAPGYVGYYIVELQIPSIVNRGAGELRLLVNGEESNRVKLYLEPDLAP